MLDERERLTDDECLAFLDAIFPNGPAGDDVMQELAPTGWANSPLVRIFHPTVEQVHEECVRMHERANELGTIFGRRKGKQKQEAPKPPPTFEETKASYVESPLQPERELREIVGLCMWEVFSDSHEVIASSGKIVDLGSFRGSADFIAVWINRSLGTTQYNYMDFYMGPWLLSRRADLQPVYEMIFRRLRAAGADWEYHFPELHAVKLPKLEDLPGEKKPPEWESYSPSAALENEEAEREEEAKEEQMAKDIAKANEEAKSNAMDRPPPKTVNAYVAVYGREPKGWPPVPESD